MKEGPYTGFYARLLGGFSLKYQDRELPISANPQTKTMQILLILLKAGKDGVDRKQLIEWFEEDGRDWNRAVNNFRQRVLLLRQIIRRSQFPDGKYVVLKDGRYYFSLVYPVKTDTGHLDQLIMRMRNGPEHPLSGDQDRETGKKMGLWDLEWEYCQHYRGEFLPMLHGETWATQESAYYQKWYFRCLSDLCKKPKTLGEYEKLLELCTVASRIHPYDEWQTVQIDCLMALNRYREAKQVYEKAAGIFYEELGVSNLDKTVARYRHKYGQMYSLANAMTGIMDELQEDDGRQGAYCCSYPSFLDAYHIVCRMEGRSHIPSVLMVCTMKPEPVKGEKTGRETLDTAMESFRQVLARAIRSDDVYTRYSSSQFLALLMDAVEEDGRKAARRLNERWKAAGEGCGWGMEILVERTEDHREEEYRNGKEGSLYCADHQTGLRAPASGPLPVS